MRMEDMSRVMVDLGYGRKRSLLQLVDAWSDHVLRLYRERDMTLAEAPSAWGVHDYIAALSIRDHLEHGLEQITEQRIPSVVEIADELLRTFTATASAGMTRLSAFDETIPTEPWWWQRLPTTGPVAEEVRAFPVSQPEAME
jgi:hypothetical protein